MPGAEGTFPAGMPRRLLPFIYQHYRGACLEFRPDKCILIIISLFKCCRDATIDTNLCFNQSLTAKGTRTVKKFRSRLLPLIDLILFPIIYPIAWLLRTIRHVGVNRMPHCKRAFLKIGFFPLRNHYYEPQFDYRTKKMPFSEDRNLPGIDWNTSEQLEMLSAFSFTHELDHVPLKKPDALEFHLDNVLFQSGDAEYWYQLIRLIRPSRIFEIGGGYSTLMTLKAIRKNREDNPDYRCRHLCIEPFERPWLEATGVQVIRKKIEDVGVAFFSELQEKDILFIDSSHVIRPQGDVTFEYLELLPVLNKGVIVQIHDIFSPRNYLKILIEDHVRFWNEQYLLEAFLCQNSNWKILGALNYLRHHHYEKLKSIAPSLTPEKEPSSFYIQKMV
jgi:hypothetical protein